jgi:glycine betaine/choline ABC-type transport system substrate-binding protein
VDQTTAISLHDVAKRTRMARSPSTSCPSRSGGVSALDLVVLEDDKALQTVDNLVPALSERAATPQNVAALNRLAATLTTEDLIELNRQVDIERRDPQEVAAEYLQAKGLVAATP